MRKPHSVLSVLIVLLVAALIAGTLVLRPEAASPLRYFPETRYLLREPFLSYFDDHGGVSVLGYPLTNAYTGADGVLVQVFQRAQLQLTVRGVELAALGRTLHLGDDQSGHVVAAEFVDFYQAHGDQPVFGPPIGPVHEEAGLLVQDFERARLVRTARGDVQLAGLGSAYLSIFPAPAPDGQAAYRLRGTPAPPPSIRANVSMGQPTVTQGDQQTIYLVVEDGEGNPVAGAQSLAILRYGNARAEVGLPPTDAQGVATTSFVAPPAPPGSQVLVEVNVLVGEVLLTVETTYFQWW